MGRARQLADGGLNDAILMDASAADTDVNDNILLNGTDSSSTDAGFNLLYENGTHDAAVTLPLGRDNLSLTGNIVQVKQGLFAGFVTLTNSGTAAVFADIFLQLGSLIIITFSFLYLLVDIVFRVTDQTALSESHDCLCG